MTDVKNGEASGLMRIVGMKTALCRATIVLFIMRWMKHNTVTLKCAIFYIVFPMI
jgi:hypothetical protein